MVPGEQSPRVAVSNLRPEEESGGLQRPWRAFAGPGATGVLAGSCSPKPSPHPSSTQNTRCCHRCCHCHRHRRRLLSPASTSRLPLPALVFLGLLSRGVKSSASVLNKPGPTALPLDSLLRLPSKQRRNRSLGAPHSRTYPHLLYLSQLYLPG